MKERLIIIFVAIIAGLFITSAGFFIYQSTKKQNDTPIAKKSQASEEKTVVESGIFVKVQEPKDEILSAKRTITVKGTTNPENIVVISSNIEDVEVKPSQEGEFSTTIDIDANANPLIIRAISPDGTSAQDIRTVTYTTEDF